MQMVGSFAEFERAMIRERTSCRHRRRARRGRIGGRRKKLDAAKRREIAESVITGRKSGADMARLYNISQPTVSRIVAQHRMAQPIVAREPTRGTGGTARACLQEAAPGRLHTNTASAEDRCGRWCGAGPPNECTTQPPENAIVARPIRDGLSETGDQLISRQERSARCGTSCLDGVEAMVSVMAQALGLARLHACGVDAR